MMGHDEEGKIGELSYFFSLSLLSFSFLVSFRGPMFIMLTLRDRVLLLLPQTL